MSTKRINIKQQSGAALIVSLILLIVLTVLSIAAMQGTTMQERMAGNYRDTNQAFQAAEAALRAGESELLAAVVGPFNASGGPGGMYTPADESGSTFRWTDPNTVWEPVTNNAAFGGSQPPEYIIEEMAPYQIPGGSLASDEPLPDSRYYRVTARGYGAAGSMVVLQSSYRRQ